MQIFVILPKFFIFFVYNVKEVSCHIIYVDMAGERRDGAVTWVEKYANDNNELKLFFLVRECNKIIQKFSRILFESKISPKSLRVSYFTRALQIFFEANIKRAMDST